VKSSLRRKSRTILTIHRRRKLVPLAKKLRTSKRGGKDLSGQAPLGEDQRLDALRRGSLFLYIERKKKGAKTGTRRVKISQQHKGEGKGGEDYRFGGRTKSR